MKIKYKSLEEFINSLKMKNEIYAILQCGNRDFKDMNLTHGDYDLAIVTEHQISKKIIGIHFYIGGIPIDCAFLDINYLKKDNPSSFDLMYVFSKVIYDKNGITSNLINTIKNIWPRNKKFNDISIKKMRYGLTHRLLKIKNSFENPIYCNFIIMETIKHIVESYSEIHELPIGKEKIIFEYMKNNDSYLYESIGECYSPNRLEVKYNKIKLACEYITSQYGGLWSTDEVIFRNIESIDHNEQKEILDFVLGTKYEE
ncbi:MAG: hypothetical protein K6G28_04710 [Acholeplasmatales bacterium]|nr:hypothetical protein [Acholeplasmatales bacterium]